MVSPGLDLRTAKSSIVVALIVWLTVSGYGASEFGIGYFWGAFGSISNIYLWHYTYKYLFSSDEQKRKIIVSVVGLVKLPVVCFFGYLAINVFEFEILGLVAGFTTPFVVILLKTLSVSLGVSKGQSVAGKKMLSM